MAKKSDDLEEAWKQGIGTVLTDWLPYQIGSGTANIMEAGAIETNQLLDEETKDKRAAAIRAQMDKAIMQSKTYRKHYSFAYGEDPYDIQAPEEILSLTQKHKSK